MGEGCCPYVLAACVVSRKPEVKRLVRMWTSGRFLPAGLACGSVFLTIRVTPGTPMYKGSVPHRGITGDMQWVGLLPSCPAGLASEKHLIGPLCEQMVLDRVDLP